MSLRAPRRFIATLAVPAVVATGVAFAGPAQAGHEDKYEGSAMALRAQVGVAGSEVLDLILPAAVSFPSGGADKVLELPEELSDVAVLKVLNVSSGLDEDKVLVSNANVSKADVLAGLVTAKVLNADCTAKDEEVSGDSQVAELSLAGMKIPIDSGPNTEIEIPEALSAFISGGITIDEQTDMPDGTLRVRALHINLVVAPAALETALESVTKIVRDAAEQVKVAVEAATGKTLEALVGQERSAPAPKAEAAPKAAAKRINVAQQDKADAETGAQAAAEVTETESTEVAAETESSEVATQTAKSDAADVSAAEAAGDTTAADADAALAERAEAGSKAAVIEQDDAAAQPAEVTAPAAAAPDAAGADAAVKSERKQARPEKADGAKSEDAKSDDAKLSVLDRVKVPAVDSEVLGALGVDVVISEVLCKGAPAVVQVAEVKDPLPDTGGDSMMARNIAISGLGLLTAGSLAVFITRRRQHVS
ncbi:MAG: choice-of-anchor P family protein [Sporichthyaceae bacterium]